VAEKPETIETDLYGEVSRRRLAHVLKNPGGKNDKDSSGSNRVWKFYTKTLNRFSNAYEMIPDTTEIVEQETLEPAISESQTNFRLFEELEGEEDSEDVAEDSEKKDIEQEPDASDQQMHP
jgi:hypothetical protein